MPVYDDGGHSTAPPNTDGAYPTGSDFINGYPDRTKSLDSGDKLHPFQGNPPDIAYGYSSPADDPSALNSGSPPSWINVPTGIAPVYDPNPNPQLPATLNTGFVYVADEQGPLDYHGLSRQGTPQYQYGYDEGDPNLQGYIWKLDVNAKQATAIIPTSHDGLYHTQDVTVDPQTGNIIVLGFTDYTRSSLPIIAVYQPYLDSQGNWQYRLQSKYNITSLLPTDLPNENDGYQVIRYDPGTGIPGTGTYYLASFAGFIAKYNPNNGSSMISPFITHLGNLDGMFLYQAPTARINTVDFETTQPSMTQNAPLVTSPALDPNIVDSMGVPHALQLSRDASMGNGVAWAEIRGSDNSYYNVPTAYYSFLFQFASQTGEGGVVNFEDQYGMYKGALHLVPKGTNSNGIQTGQLLFYDAQGNVAGTGTATLNAGQTYTISAMIGSGDTGAWEVRVTDSSSQTVIEEMRGTAKLGANNGGLLLGGHDPYTTNYYYDDVTISSAGLSGAADAPVEPPPGAPTPTFNAQTYVPFANQVVATFTDPSGSQDDYINSRYPTTIDWGDQSPLSTGTVTYNNGTFTVTGNHTYTQSSAGLPNGMFMVTVTIQKKDAPQTVIEGMATVSGPTASLPFLPFEDGDYKFAQAMGFPWPRPIESTVAPLDGGDSLQVLRRNTDMKEINYDIRDDGSGNPATQYSFLFKYVSTLANSESDVADFLDTSGNPKASLHLTDTGNLILYDNTQMPLASTSMANFPNLLPNQACAISVTIPSTAGAPWGFSVNGRSVGGSTSGSFGSNPNGGIRLGGTGAYTTNYFYDDVVIQQESQFGMNTPSISVNSLVNPSQVGQAVTFTATVSGNGTVPPTGNVYFYDTNMTYVGMGMLGPGNGTTATATFTTNRLLAGTHAISATYRGDGTYAAVSASLPNGQTVAPASTTTLLIASTSVATPGQQVTFTATISVNAPGTTQAGNPTGLVIFSDNGNSIGQGTLSTAHGMTTASFTTTSLQLGNHPITASYQGDGNFAGSLSASTSVAVQPPVLISYPPSPQTVYEGSAQSVGLGSFSDTGPGPWTVTVFWGDGSNNTVLSPGAPGPLPSQLHTYAEAGTYPVTVLVRDTGDNALSGAGFFVSVNDVPVSPVAVPVAPTAGAPFTGPVATFTDPGGAESNDGTHYMAAINWGDGPAVSMGSITFSSGVFTVNGTHTYAAANTDTITVTILHGGLPPTQVQSPVTTSSLGQFVSGPLAEATSFWESLRGQQLIRRFGLTSSGQTLGQWLASTFPNLYENMSGGPNLNPFTNAQISYYYQNLFVTSQGTGLDVEILDTALDVFASTLSLGGTIGQSYGFTVNSNGLGAYSWNIGSSGAAFGTPNNTVLDVFQILLAANNNAVSGEPWGSNTLLRNEASTVFQGINAA